MHRIDCVFQVTRIKEFGDVSKLSKADQFFSQVRDSNFYVVPSFILFQVMTIPRLSQRLECMVYRRKLEIEIEEIRPELNIVRNASRELRSSHRFKAILQVSSRPHVTEYLKH